MYTITICRTSSGCEEFNHVEFEDAKARYFSLTMGLRKGGDIVYISLIDRWGYIAYDWEG